MTANLPIQSLIAELDRHLSATTEQETVTVSPEFLQQLRAVLSDREAMTVNPTAIATAVVEQLHQQNLSSVSSSVSLSEVTALRQQRDLLHREIQNLEAHRQQLIAEFLQVLLSRVSESIKQEVSQTVESIESQFLYAIAPTSEDTSEAAISLTQLPGNPSQRLEQIKYLQQESDRLFISLDSTLQTVFSTLEKDLIGYQESLATKASQMYNAANLQSETLPQPSLPDISEPLDLPLNFQASEKTPELATSEVYPAVTPVQLPDAAVLYPFPGMELPTDNPQITSEAPEADPIDFDNMADAEIDVLLELDEEVTPVNEAPQTAWEAALFEENVALTPPPLEESETEAAEELTPETTRLEDADTPEEQLFGTTAIPPEVTATAPEATVSDATVVEEELYTETAAEEPQPEPETIAEPEPEPVTPVPESDRPPIEETISSLTELLSQAYVDETSEDEGDMMPFTPVPVGENLSASEEIENTSTPAVSDNLDPEQLEHLKENLKEDLERFQEGGEGETIDVSATPVTTDSAEVPAELMGENLEQVSVESLAQEEEDMWADPPGEETSETEMPIPAEINPEPWSGSTSTTTDNPNSPS
ncbi:MAG: hypothetical protein SAJ12_10645 [Jaaginema sp. PMC 1079.18]|nr:hypothetical protein [Jaaginema sp. PMC 1080.18]MEC4851460.1 hypothetical protein [Jaaginema sp. PMC 1079.18]MEC4865952.1 hypothetical protein [Jaaginema sp. PMC 1078.18]